ncbi:MAG TPA: ATP-binding protein [Myxococcales bacterium]
MEAVYDSDSPQVPRDPAMAVLRVAIVVFGVVWAFLQPSAQRMVLLHAFGGYAVYSALLYALAYRPLIKGSGRKFYLVAGVLDLAFAVLLIQQTGGIGSPFVRALNLWVALLAFLFGLTIGSVGSVVALAVLFAFDLQAGLPGDPLAVIIRSGGLLLHGPLVGYLSDRERARIRTISKTRDDLAEANRRLVGEQAKLIQAEKLSSIGMLASGVAHEINNPLMGVMGCVKALSEHSVDEKRTRDYFEAVQDGLERIRGTVQSLLDFARQRPPSPSALDAAEVIDSVTRLLQPLARKKDVEVASSVRSGEAQVQVDRTQIMQALVNVVMNALQAVKNGGRIRIAVVRGSGLGDEPRLVGLRVEDDGVGMPKDVVAKVCDPFFTTKPEGEGTGLGMAITQGIVRAHGGDLTIESEVGVGTKVTLWLPAGTVAGEGRGSSKEAVRA